MANPKPSDKWGFQSRKISKFKLNKMGCRHYMTPRLSTIDTLESSCVYCGVVVRYEIPNETRLDRGARVEATTKEQNNNINQKKSNNNKGV